MQHNIISAVGPKKRSEEHGCRDVNSEKRVIFVGRKESARGREKRNKLMLRLIIYHVSFFSGFEHCSTRVSALRTYKSTGKRSWHWTCALRINKWNERTSDKVSYMFFRIFLDFTIKIWRDELVSAWASVCFPRFLSLPFSNYLSSTSYPLPELSYVL